MRTLFILVALGAAATSMGEAQTLRPAGLDPGQRAIEIALPDGGGTDVGLWWVKSPRTQVGLTGTVSYNSSEAGTGESQNSWTVLIGPGIRRAVAVSLPIVPFWRADAQFGVGGGSGTTPDLILLSASAGFGADWFPFERISIGGHMGLRTSYVRQTSDIPAGGSSTQSSVNVGTFRSGLTLRLFF